MAIQSRAVIRETQLVRFYPGCEETGSLQAGEGDGWREDRSVAIISLTRRRIVSQTSV